MIGRLFGRDRRPKANLDGVFALLTSMPDLEARGLTATGKVGVCVRVSEETAFDQAVDDTEATAHLYAREHAARFDSEKDGMGCLWWTTDAPKFEDVVTLSHLLASEMGERGFADRLLALVVPMDAKDHGPWYLVYGYKRGRYYPFCPSGDHTRDNAREMRLASEFPNGLPKEEELERWYALWDPPIPTS